MKNKNYFVVQGWMVNDLQLKGNDLLLFALIWGFSQDEASAFRGTSKYLEQSIGASRNTVRKSVKNLEEKGFIVKNEVNINGVVFNELSVNIEGIRIDPPGQKLTTPRSETDPNNNIYKDNIEDNKLSSMSSNELAASKSGDKTTESSTNNPVVDDDGTRLSEVSPKYPPPKLLYEKLRKGSRLLSVENAWLKEWFLILFNETREEYAKSIGMSFRPFKTLDVKTLGNLKKYFKLGYDIGDFIGTIQAAHQIRHHMENHYKYLTPELLLRETKFERFLQIAQEKELV